jgi:hypothetical protein
MMAELNIPDNKWKDLFIAYRKHVMREAGTDHLYMDTYVMRVAREAGIDAVALDDWAKANHGTEYIDG